MCGDGAVLTRSMGQRLLGVEWGRRFQQQSQTALRHQRARNAAAESRQSPDPQRLLTRSPCTEPKGILGGEGGA